MPVIIEAEYVNGETFQWVTDADTFEKLIRHLGEPILDVA